MIIIHMITGQIQVAHTKIQLTCNHASIRCLSRTRWSIKKISASIRYTFFNIPFWRCLEVLDVSNYIFWNVLIQNDWLQRSLILNLSFNPGSTPSLLFIDDHLIILLLHVKYHSIINEFFQNCRIRSISIKLNVLFLNRLLFPSLDSGSSFCTCGPHVFILIGEVSFTSSNQVL